MWCSNCQQDVPAVTQPGTGRFACSRCQRHQSSSNPSVHASISDAGIALDDPVAASTAAASPRCKHDWAVPHRLRHLDRELRRTRLATAATTPLSHSLLRFDGSMQSLGTIGSVPVAAQTSEAASRRTKRNQTGQVLGWSIVLAGALALVTGIGLLAWSLTIEEKQYWNLSLGFMLGGQGGLILGLVLVVSRLWRTSRYAAQKLQEVQLRLGQLQQTAETLAATRGAGSPSFYSELARGANPHILLANLKGQVDQLTTQLNSLR